MIAYLDCSTGISGDKFLGALIDAGFSPDDLRAALSPLGIDPADVLVKRVTSGGISAISVRLAPGAESAAESAKHVTGLRDLLLRAELPERARQGALTAFDLIAVAEAQVHGASVDEVHLHEVGAHDTILDLVGVALGLAELDVGGLVCTPIAVGSGTIVTSHGLLPVPTPATAQLLLGAPVTAGPSLDGGEAAGELTTPTGAALVRAFVSEFGPMPPMVPQAVGYGAGMRDLGFPNVARIVIGELAGREAPPLNAASVQADERAPLTELVTVLETNIDHLTSEELAFAADELLSAGALDVWQAPIVMKKGRAAVALSVLCEPAGADTFAARIEDLTGTLGVRRSDPIRYVVAREVRTMRTRYGPVRVKIAHIGESTRPRAEHEDVARIARQLGESLLEVSAHVAEDVAAGVFLE